MKQFWLFLFSTFLFANAIFANYQIMDKTIFEEKVVGNTIVGVTRQSQSCYMLYFLADGYCMLWKQNQIYPGKWWVDQNLDGEDIVHAFWPEYTSVEQKSLFSPENPSYGKPTSVRYYYNQANGEMLVKGKTYQAPVLLIPGCAFSIF